LASFSTNAGREPQNIVQKVKSMRDAIAVVLAAVLVFSTHAAEAENEHFKPFIVVQSWRYP
jgi:hypothetical protein